MNRSLFLSNPPRIEPVTLEEALAQCHADAGIEDDWFVARITSGRQKVEDYVRRSLITQSWTLRYDVAPAVVELPRSPIQEVTRIVINGIEKDVNNFAVNLEAIPGVVKLHGNSGERLHIDYRAGYGDTGAAVPGPFKDAILLYVAYSYGNREGEADVPKAFYDLINPYRIYGL